MRAIARIRTPGALLANCLISIFGRSSDVIVYERRRRRLADAVAHAVSPLPLLTEQVYALLSDVDSATPSAPNTDRQLCTFRERHAHTSLLRQRLRFGLSSSRLLAHTLVPLRSSSFIAVFARSYPVNYESSGAC